MNNSIKLAGFLVFLGLGLGGVDHCLARGPSGPSGRSHAGGSFGGSRGGSSFGGVSRAPAFHSGGGSSFGGVSRAPAIHSGGGSSFGGVSRAPAIHSGVGSSFHSPTAGRPFNTPNFTTHSGSPRSPHFPSGATVHSPRISSNTNQPLNHPSWHGGGNWQHQSGHWDRDWGGSHYRHYGHVPVVVTSPWYPYWWGYGPFDSWYGYPSVSYYGCYPSVDYPVVSVYSPTYAVAPTQPIIPPAAADSTDAPQLLGAAHDAFRSGDYANAMRLANHAAIEMPRNPKPHELMSLALFALKDYRGANLEAHAALSLGPACDWDTLYGYYGDVAKYQQHLDALVDHIGAHRDAADARFLLAYHDMMMGHQEAAKEQLDAVLSRVPQDQVAAQLLTKLGGTPPTTAAKPAPQPIPPPAQADTPKPTGRNL